MIRVQETVRKETLRIAAGTAVLTVLMVAVFLLLGMFDWTVLLGAVYGCFFAVLNFFLMALAVQKAAESMNGVQLPPEEEVPEGEEAPEKPLSPQAQEAKKRMQLSYHLRIGVAAPCFHAVAALVPLLFPRLVIMVIGFTQKN